MDLHNPLQAIHRNSDDSRRARILEGALKVFLAYGFNRATMDDIAKAGELSRPALYLLFRNKTDIYRAIATCVLEECVAQAKAVLSGRGSLSGRLDRLIEEVFHPMMQEIESSPHGTDLLDMHNRLAGDIIAEWRGALDSALEQAIVRHAEGAGVDLAARDLTARAAAQVFFDSMEGMRVRLRDPSSHPAAAKSAARLLVAALRP